MSISSIFPVPSALATQMLNGQNAIRRFPPVNQTQAAAQPQPNSPLSALTSGLSSATSTAASTLSSLMASLPGFASKLGSSPGTSFLV